MASRRFIRSVWALILGVAVIAVGLVAGYRLSGAHDSATSEAQPGSTVAATGETVPANCPTSNQQVARCTRRGLIDSQLRTQTTTRRWRS